MNVILSAAREKLTILARSCANFALRSSIVIVSVELSSPFSAGSCGSSEIVRETIGLSPSICGGEAEDTSWAAMVPTRVKQRNALSWFGG